MKKRFTLMMMVLCFLMSIPLKMMAQTVISDEITAKSHYKQNWGVNPNFKFTTTDGKIYTCVLKNVTDANVWFRIVKNDKEWGPNSDEDLVLTSAYQQAYEDKTSSAFKIEKAQGSSYTITWNNETNQIKCDKEGSSSGPGGGSTTVEWDTENINRLKDKPRVYTQGFYLAGNFFSFSDPNKVTYDDAVFKFQQQKNKPIGGTDYEIYKVEIPASLTAHAQVMYVDEIGKKQNIFGPASTNGCGISYTYPVTDGDTGWKDLTKYTKFEEKDNYWNFVSRNVTAENYSDGMYELYIAFDKNTNSAKWMIKHIQKKRVAYFICTEPSATALPVYDYTKKTSGTEWQYSNQFFATVYFASDRDYYVISNYINKTTSVH